MKETLFERDLRRAVQEYAKANRIDPAKVDASLRGFLGATLLWQASPALRAAYLSGVEAPPENP